MKTQKAAKLAVWLFFAAVTAAGLMACGGYGAVPAEDSQIAGRIFGWITAGFEGTAAELSMLWQAYIWLWFMLGVYALYAICRNTGLGRPVSCLGALMLCLCPRFFAQGHYDAGILLLSAALCLLWAALRFAKKPGVLRGIWLALAAAWLGWLLIAQDGPQASMPCPTVLWMMITAFPLYALPLACAGLAAVGRRFWERRREALRDPVSMLLAAAVLFWLLPLAGNGFDWRFACFAYAGLMVLAAQGISAMYRFGRHFGGDCGMHLVLLAGLLLFFGWTARDIARNHPNQYAYYNRIGHEAAAASPVLDPDNLSASEALEALLTAERNPKRKLTVSAWESAGQPGLERAHTLLSAEEQKTLKLSKKKNAPYLISNAGYARAEEKEAPEGYRELLQIQSYGVTLCTIYEKE